MNVAVVDIGTADTRLASKPFFASAGVTPLVTGVAFVSYLANEIFSVLGWK
jgi:hypothetical protein